MPLDLTATLTVNSAPPVQANVRLLGPGDVVGIDPQQVVRTDPRPGTADFEPNYLAAIEFDRPDYPWLFTPAAAGADARLRPWLVLVVVRAAQDGIALLPPGEGPLPVLDIRGPASAADELPDLNDSWCWAHAQASRANGIDVAGALNGAPELSLSRLLCPRLLAPETEYLACVVPAFDIGRRAGLGETVPDGELGSARTELGARPGAGSGARAGVLPLVVPHRLRRRLRKPGAAAESRSPHQPASARGRSTSAARGSRCRPIFLPARPCRWVARCSRCGPATDRRSIGPRTPATRSRRRCCRSSTPPATCRRARPGSDPLLAPPLYGRWHAARATASAGVDTVWFDLLNADPRHRVIAALGTRVVQEHQEALMASAWEQAADLQRANQRLRQLQLGLVVNASLHARHFGRMGADALMRVSGPAIARVRPAADSNATALTLLGDLTGTALPPNVMSAGMRRLVRPRGPISRRFAQMAGGNAALFYFCRG